MGALLRRDVILLARSPALWMSGLVFFVLFLTLCAIALGGNIKLMRPSAPALIWLAVLFSLLLSFGSLFRADFEDGSIEHLMLSNVGGFNIALSRAIAVFICVLMPIIAASPIAGMLFALSTSEMVGMILSLFLAAPALTAYGILTAGLMAGRPQAGFLSVLITAPFLVPILIFGVAAVRSYGIEGMYAAEFKALAGISLIGCAVGLPAAGAALKANLE